MKDFISLIKTVSINVCKIFQPFREEKEGECEIDVTISVAKAKENLYKNLNGFSFITSTSNFFNLEVVEIIYYSYCAMSN